MNLIKWFFVLLFPVSLLSQTFIDMDDTTNTYGNGKPKIYVRGGDVLWNKHSDTDSIYFCVDTSKKEINWSIFLPEGYSLLKSSIREIYKFKTNTGYISLFDYKSKKQAVKEAIKYKEIVDLERIERWEEVK